MNRLIRNYAMIAAGVALAGGFLPGTSLILGGLELLMIRAIARQHGEEMRWTQLTKVGGYIFSAGEMLKIAAIEGATLIPVVGWWVVKPAIAVSAVVAFGKAADLFYRRKAQGVDSPIERLLTSSLADNNAAPPRLVRVRRRAVYADSVGAGRQ